MNKLGLELTIMNKARELNLLNRDMVEAISILRCRDSRNVLKLKKLMKLKVDKCSSELDQLLNYLEE